MEKLADKIVIDKIKTEILNLIKLYFCEKIY